MLLHCIYQLSIPLFRFKKALLLTEILIKMQMSVNKHYSLTINSTANDCALITGWNILKYPFIIRTHGPIEWAGLQAWPFSTVLFYYNKVPMTANRQSLNRFQI